MFNALWKVVLLLVVVALEEVLYIVVCMKFFNLACREFSLFEVYEIVLGPNRRNGVFSAHFASQHLLVSHQHSISMYGVCTGCHLTLVELR